jgi:hypothetical protein
MKKLRVILWRDYNDVVHAFQQSKNHDDDWNPLCNVGTVELGSHPRDIEKVMTSVRRAAVVPVEGAVTCVICAAKYTG